MAFSIPAKTLNAQQDVVFSYARDKYNTEKLAADPSFVALTSTQYWNQVILQGLLDSYTLQWRTAQAKAAGDAWLAANP